MEVGIAVAQEYGKVTVLGNLHCIPSTSLDRLAKVLLIGVTAALII